MTGKSLPNNNRDNIENTMIFQVKFGNDIDIVGTHLSDQSYVVPSPK